MKKRVTEDPASDGDLFAREMADVVPLSQDPRGRAKVRPPVLPKAVDMPRAERPDDHDDGLDSFSAPGIDRREIRKLKRGDYPVAARRDLHGATAKEAAASVQRFIDSSRRSGHRCICIVHGRGLHSEGNVSILKTRVRECLRAHPAVLAYADPPRSDGGAGAVYVLLRK